MENADINQEEAQLCLRSDQFCIGFPVSPVPQFPGFQVPGFSSAKVFQFLVSYSLLWEILEPGVYTYKLQPDLQHLQILDEYKYSRLAGGNLRVLASSVSFNI